MLILPARGIIPSREHRILISAFFLCLLASRRTPEMTVPLETPSPQSQQGPSPLPGAAVRRRRIVAGVGFEPVVPLAVPGQIHAAVVPRPVVEDRRLVDVHQVDAQAGLLAARGRAPEASVVADAVALDRDLAGVLDVDAVPALSLIHISEPTR